MVIVKENKAPLKESLSLEDVVGLSGFRGYKIVNPNLYVEKTDIPSMHGTIYKGPGQLSNLDISLVAKRTATVSFPVNTIKLITVNRLNVLFTLKDNTIIEFYR